MKRDIGHSSGRTTRQSARGALAFDDAAQAAFKSPRTTNFVDDLSVTDLSGGRNGKDFRFFTRQRNETATPMGRMKN
jgi:hypothetical protein